MEIDAAKMVGAGLAAIGMIGAGIGVGNIFAAFITAVGRNPAVAKDLRQMTLLGFAVTEAIALFALMVGVMIIQA